MLLGLNIGKLLFDEKFRYYLYVMVPDIMYQVDKVTDLASDKWTATKDEYNLPTNFSREQIGKFVWSLRERREKNKELRAVEKEKQRRESLREKIETDVYLLKMEGRYNDELEAERQELIKKLEDT